MNELFINIENFVLQNIATFSITIFGVAMTVFTVIYSFIVSKKNYRKELGHLQSIGKVSPYVLSEYKFSNEYIRKLRKVNVHIIILVFDTVQNFV